MPFPCSCQSRTRVRRFTCFMMFAHAVTLWSTNEPSPYVQLAMAAWPGHVGSADLIPRMLGMMSIGCPTSPTPSWSGMHDAGTGERIVVQESAGTVTWAPDASLPVGLNGAPVSPAKSEIQRWRPMYASCAAVRPDAG